MSSFKVRRIQIAEHAGCMTNIIYLGINWRSYEINDRTHIKMNFQKQEDVRALDSGDSESRLVIR
jgi:hypothetical protein